MRTVVKTCGTLARDANRMQCVILDPNDSEKGASGCIPRKAWDIVGAMGKYNVGLPGIKRELASQSPN